MKKSDWISVEDKLPEEEGRYAVLYDQLPAIKGRLWIGDWYPREKEWGNEIGGTIITHWQSLPEPPE